MHKILILCLALSAPVHAQRVFIGPELPSAYVCPKGMDGMYCDRPVKKFVVTVMQVE